MKSKYNIKKQNIGHLFAALVVERESNSRNVISKMNASIIDEVLEDNKIESNNVNSIMIYRDKKKIKIEIEYCKLNIADYNQGTKEEQIVKLMDVYGYNQNMIKKIKYNKKDKICYIEINSGYATDDLAARGEEALIENEIKKILCLDTRVMLS